MVATSDEAKASDELRNMLARTAEWQDWTGLNEADSKLRINITEIDSGDIGSLPRIRIGQGEGAEHSQKTFASGQGGMSSGRLLLTFMAAYVGSGAWETEEETMTNKTGQVIGELLEDTEGLVNIGSDRGTPATKPDLADKAANQLIRKQYTITFGLDGLSD